MRAVFIGQSPVDIIVRVRDEFLPECGLKKSHTFAITADQSAQIAQKIKDEGYDLPDCQPGGGAANTACIFARLGGETVFNGKITSDDYGQMFLKSLQVHNIDYPNQIYDPSILPSDHLYTLITPDNERSFASCYGITSQLSFDDLDRQALDEADVIFLEGFLFNTKGGFEVMKQVAQYAKEKENPALIAYSTSDPNVTKMNLDQTRELLPQIDILFMNDLEADVLFPGKSMIDVIKACKSHCRYGAITMAEKGAYVFDQGQILKAPANPVDPASIKNSNGAGDAFAGAFLYAMQSDQGLKAALELGQEYAVRVIQSPSSRIPHLS